MFLPLRVRSYLGWPPVTAPDERIYAIGDVHGRLDLLKNLLENIRADHVQRAPINTRFVFLGDLVDRGPSSLAVLRFVKAIESRSDRVIALMGNHEATLLDCLDGDTTTQALWLRHGGSATLQSLGLDVPETIADSVAFGHALEAKLGDTMVEWLRKRPVHHRSGDYFFCHAGVRPGVPLALQDNEDLLWIRSEFLTSERHHGAVIVHGHTPCETVEVLANRINLDTGAYESGILSAIGLEGAQRWLLSTTEETTPELQKKYEIVTDPEC